MAFAPHIHDLHWLHGAGRMWHRHVVAAWTITLGSVGLVVALALLINSGSRGVSFDDRIPVSDALLTGQAGKPITALGQALRQAEVELGQTGAPRAKLQVAHRAWELAQALPIRRNAEYRLLLLRAAELLADPEVVDVMGFEDRILKALITVELAPRIDPIGIPARRPA